MKIIVTGYSGFIGSYLTKKLQQNKHELILLDISGGVDICEWNQVRDFGNIDLIIHLANLSYVPASYSDPLRFYKTNFSGTLNMLELCRLNKARMIFFSSYVYGHPQYQPIDENHPVKAFNPYAQTKVICESLCEGYNRDFDVPVTVFRPFNIYGTGQHPDFLIPTIIRQAIEGKIEIKDDRPKRDYIHVEDVVEAVITVAAKQQKGYHVYNLGCGVSYSVKELVDKVSSLFDHQINYSCKNEFRPNEVMDTVADIRKIRDELGWSPRIGMEEGIKKIINQI